MRMKPSLTSDDVVKIMAACKAEAAKNNWKVSICVVDEGGNLLHFERPDDVRAMTAEICLGKARTAALTTRPSAATADALKERPGMLKLPVLGMQGGMPIIHQGTCVGAIGVSGVQSHEDEQVAKAGVAAVS